MSSSLNALINKAQQQLSELEYTLHQLEFTDYSLTRDSDVSPISAAFAVINTNLRECTDLAKREPNPDRRDQYQDKIKEMRRQYDKLKVHLNTNIHLIYYDRVTWMWSKQSNMKHKKDNYLGTNKGTLTCSMQQTPNTFKRNIPSCIGSVKEWTK